MRQKSSDRIMLNTFRLAQQVGTLDSADDYLEMAEMLLEAGLPGEAKSVMEAGLAAKVVDPADKARSDRYKRRLDDAKAAAAKDLQSLPQIEKDAQKSATGQGDVALGMAYSSFGQYDKAVAALAKGLEKGGVRDPDQAQIMLGIADLKLGKKAEAVKAFEQVKADPQMADIARLWAIVAKSGG
jgi:tetratricopeptide (TPR) repeat protein